MTSTVKGTLISVRLDSQAEEALGLLMRGGANRSAAVREALVEAAQRRSSEALRAEARALAANPADRAEAAAVLEFMESLRAAW
jgi:Arc/MetJ-type ribon-helix-helix transcriptional regulator